MINNFYKIKNNTLIGIDEKRFKKSFLVDKKMRYFNAKSKRF